LSSRPPGRLALSTFPPGGSVASGAAIALARRVNLSVQLLPKLFILRETLTPPRDTLDESRQPEAKCTFCAIQILGAGQARRLIHSSSENHALNMSNPFFDQPILNSPYACPQQHWELDNDGQPTQKVEDFRRKAKFITPIPKPKKRRKSAADQEEIVFDEGKGISTKEQQYDPTSIINEVRGYVDTWRNLPSPRACHALLANSDLSMSMAKASQ
jgi:hypothetical protein